MSNHQQRAEALLHLLGAVSVKRLKAAKAINLRWNNSSAKCSVCRSHSRFTITTPNESVPVCDKHAIAAIRVAFEDLD